MKSAARTASRPTGGKRELILTAALERFSHYGFRRTSMEDIAQQAGISRAAVYRHFGNKEDVFRALAEAMHEKAMAEVEQAGRGTGSVGTRLAGALGAKLAAFFDLVSSTAHARELIDEN